MPLPTSKSTQDMNNVSETNAELSTGNSIAAKRRLFHENALINSSLSSDTTNSLSNGQDLTLLNVDLPRSRANTVESLENLGSTKTMANQPKPHFDIITDLPMDSNDSLPMDSAETKSQLINSNGDDDESISSSTKSRKSIRSSKLFKSFSNLRFRKKTNTT